MARGEGRLLEEGDYFKYFSQRGAFIQARRLIKGRLLFEKIRELLYPICSKVIFTHMDDEGSVAEI